MSSWETRVNYVWRFSSYFWMVQRCGFDPVSREVELLLAYSVLLSKNIPFIFHDAKYLLPVFLLISLFKWVSIFMEHSFLTYYYLSGNFSFGLGSIWSSNPKFSYFLTSRYFAWYSYRRYSFCSYFLYSERRRLRIFEELRGISRVWLRPLLLSAAGADATPCWGEWRADHYGILYPGHSTPERLFSIPAPSSLPAFSRKPPNSIYHQQYSLRIKIPPSRRRVVSPKAREGREFLAILHAQNWIPGYSCSSRTP